VDLQAKSLPVTKKAGCAGIANGNSYGTNWWTQYGYFERPFLVHGAASLDEASSNAIALAQEAGFKVLNDANHKPFYGECGAPHGAVIGKRKPSEATGRWAPLPLGVWDLFGLYTAKTTDEAISQGMAECKSWLDLDNPHSIYVKAGITECEVIDSF
jgi:hypothetical protein